MQETRDSSFERPFSFRTFFLRILVGIFGVLSSMIVAAIFSIAIGLICYSSGLSGANIYLVSPIPSTFTENMIIPTMIGIPFAFSASFMRIFFKDKKSDQQIILMISMLSLLCAVEIGFGEIATPIYSAVLFIIGAIGSFTGTKINSFLLLSCCEDGRGSGMEGMESQIPGSVSTPPSRTQPRSALPPVVGNSNNITPFHASPHQENEEVERPAPLMRPSSQIDPDALD